MRKTYRGAASSGKLVLTGPETWQNNGDILEVECSEAQFDPPVIFSVVGAWESHELLFAMADFMGYHLVKNNPELDWVLEVTND